MSQVLKCLININNYKKHMTLIINAFLVGVLLTYSLMYKIILYMIKNIHQLVHIFIISDCQTKCYAIAIQFILLLYTNFWEIKMLINLL